jgi:hypothetical protein
MGARRGGQMTIDRPIQYELWAKKETSRGGGGGMEELALTEIEHEHKNFKKSSKNVSNSNSFVIALRRF